MSEYSRFLQRAREKASDDGHRRKILKAITSYNAAVSAMKMHQFQDWQAARQQAATVKAHVLAHLPELLETFENKISARGAKVLWAEDAAQAREFILDIVRRRAAKKVVKSKSMTTEEIDLNPALESEGVEVWESDLGELIVQLGGEKPYHIVTPAMHKSKEEIADLFQRTLNAPPTDSAEELTMVARRHLRNAYVTADIGITGANFIIAEEGAILMTENEGNGRLTMSCPPVHVVLVGIEKVIPRLAHLALFLPLLATSGTGQEITCYNSIVRGPKQPGEPDGPEEMIVILLDNGRSRLYAREQYADSLTCIRCGACLNACPVFRTIGGHAYGTTYQGPIGSVLTPQLRGLAQWHHLAFASSLCAACTEACPVGIDLHHMLLENRWEAVQRKAAGPFWSAFLKTWAGIMSSRQRLQRFRRLARFGAPLLPLIAFLTKRKSMPKLAPKSFAELWEDDEHAQ